MRISQNMIYGSVSNNANRALTDYYNYYEQYSTQKKVNKPSDDATGMSKILNLRSRIDTMDSWLEGVSTAKGWLAEADSQLNNASETLISIKELATQGATGTLNYDDLQNVAVQVRQYYEQLLSISNTDFAGDSIFAGSKTDGNAFEMVLGATVKDSTLDDSAVLSVEGNSDTSYLVQFTTDGTVGTDALNYRYSTDGGASWTTATLAAGATQLDLGGVYVNMATGSVVDDASDGDGTQIIVRPSAKYIGDHDQTNVINYCAADITSSASGTFKGEVLVRIDTAATLPGSVDYSYSSDGGTTWVSGLNSTDGTLNVAGGILSLSPGGGNTLAAGDQFVIRTSRSDISLDVGSSSSVVVNSVGMDIFGGLVEDPATGAMTNSLPGEEDENAFEVIGELIGYLEVGDQAGVGDCLERLTAVQDHILSAASDVGAKEERLSTIEGSLTSTKESLTTSLSNTEDADLTGLTVELTQTQNVYKMVLSTASEIMSTSLVDYL